MTDHPEIRELAALRQSVIDYQGTVEALEAEIRRLRAPARADPREDIAAILDAVARKEPDPVRSNAIHYAASLVRSLTSPDDLEPAPARADMGSIEGLVHDIRDPNGRCPTEPLWEALLSAIRSLAEGGDARDRDATIGRAIIEAIEGDSVLPYRMDEDERFALAASIENTVLRSLAASWTATKETP